MSEYRTIDFTMKDKKGKEIALFRIESRWGGYTYDTVDFLLEIAARIERIRIKESEPSKIVAKLIVDMSQDYADPNGDHVYVQPNAPRSDSEEWGSTVDLTDPAHPRYLMSVFVCPTLGEELDNFQEEDRSALIKDHGFVEIGDDPLDVGVFVALRDGIPMSAGGLMHLKDMIETSPDECGGFIPYGCKIDEGIIEVY